MTAKGPYYSALLPADDQTEGRIFMGTREKNPGSIRQEIMDGLADSVVRMDSESAAALSRRALDENVSAEEALEKGLAKGMERAGDLFSRGEYFVPEIVVCADALYAGMEILKPALPKTAKAAGRVVIGVVEWYTQDIGKNIVVKLLDAAGFEVYDLGNNVPLGEFTRKALEVDADIIALSALVTTTMKHMETVIRQVREACTDRYRSVIVGGAPVSQEYADRIGADGYAEDAPKTVRLARRLMGIEERPQRLCEYIRGRNRRLPSLDRRCRAEGVRMHHVRHLPRPEEASRLCHEDGPGAERTSSIHSTTGGSSWRPWACRF
jgi:methanogenic corrinoid protein MtbC1